MSKKIFISYRRQDTAPAAGRLYDRLCRLLSKPNVFLDVSTIAGGEDFVTAVTAAIKQSDAVLVFIGKRWLEPGDDGTIRIWETGDHVRAEVRVALEHASIVLPVLVDGAQMPGLEQLPEDLRAISVKNALPLRHESFDDDTENIVATILGTSRKARLWDEGGKLGAKVRFALGGLVAALAIWVLGGLLFFWLRGHFLAESIGNAATAVLLVAAIVAGAWLGYLYEGRRRRRRLQGLM